MGKPKDITNRVFGRLKAIKPLYKKGKLYIWQLECKCGEIVESPVAPLLNGSTKSCGCYSADILRTSPSKLHYIDGTLIESIKSKKIRSDNRSGVKGVAKIKKTGKWRAYITFKGKLYYLGVYSNLKDAADARAKAEENLFGDFLKWYEENKK